MKKEDKKCKIAGVTLIALVITIIILLILAGTTLNLLIGDNGILNKTQLAKEEYTNAQKTEKQDLDNLYSQMLIATNDDSKITISVADLKTLINEQVKQELDVKLQNINIDYSNTDNKITYTKSVEIPANSWLENIEGPAISSGTWLIFMYTYNVSNEWTTSGISGTACDIEFSNPSHDGRVGSSGYYSGKGTTLRSNVYNGNSSVQTYNITFRAIKLSNSY